MKPKLRKRGEFAQITKLAYVWGSLSVTPRGLLEPAVLKRRDARLPGTPEHGSV